MRKAILLAIVVAGCLYGCHAASVTRFDDTHYERTTAVQVFTDVTNVPFPYTEIGYVEANGGVGVSKTELLEDMKKKAMEEGANALIKVDFYDSYDGQPHAKGVMIRYKKDSGQ